MSPAAPEKPVVFSNSARLERKAGAIGDPIERLKYLRRATAVPVVKPRRRWTPVVGFSLVVLLLCLQSDAHLRRSAEVHHAVTVIPEPDQSVPNVWRVEATRDYEVYSNGLRIENNLAVSNQPRAYGLVSVEDVLRPNVPLDPAPAPPHFIPRTQPAGILFHTTESDQVPFVQTQQHNLERITRDTLLFVRNKRSYHFLIDRFGRVHRIVVESDAANHAGNSVWADSHWLYLELNQSFLGVAFEASMQTEPAPVTQAQIDAARVLTEMLRSKYNIPASNCVTHAQVSVNPDNMRIGWHSDWGRGFPFAQVGLSDNYERPLPSLYLFGFRYDEVYRNATGPGIWKGIAVAEERLRQLAEARKTTVPKYRSFLQKRYSDEMRALRQWSAEEEN